MRTPRSTARRPTTTPVVPGPKPKLEKKNPKGETEFHRAVLRSNVAAAEMLLRAGANANTTDNFGWTPLHEACNKGATELVRLLVAHSTVEVNTCGTHEVKRMKLTPLHDAAANGHIDACQLLVRAGADPFLLDVDGSSPLAAAIEEDHDATANYLRGVTGSNTTESPLAIKPVGKGQSHGPSEADSPSPMETEPSDVAGAAAPANSKRQLGKMPKSPRKATTITDAQLQSVRDTLLHMWKRTRTDTASVADVRNELAARRAAADLSTAELQRALASLADENIVMVTTDGTIIRI